MARRRLHLRRWLLLALLALLVALLLALNQFLPGVWPGGGGPAGSLRTPAGLHVVPPRVAPPPTPPPPRPPPPAARPLLVVVAPPQGTESVRVELRSWEGAATLPTVDGAARFEEPPGRFDAILALAGAQGLVHGAPSPSLGRTLHLAWPSAPLPRATPPTRGPLLVQVEDAAGRPLEGAEVSWAAAGREGQSHTDAAGSTRIEDPPAMLVRVCALSAGHGETCGHASAFAHGPTVLRLSPLLRLSTTFVDPATGQALRPTTLSLRTRDGAVRAIARPEDGSPTFEIALPTDQARGAFLDIGVPGRPLLRRALEGLEAETAVPAGRQVLVTVRDATGRPVGEATLTARFPAGTNPEAEDGEDLVETTRTDGEGRARLAVPNDRPSDLLVVPMEEAPTSRRLDVEEEADLEVIVERSVSLRVLVRDAAGAPLPRARVLASSRAGTSVATREARTDERGQAVLGGLSRGRVEVLAHATGHAWAWTLAEAQDATPELVISLERGRRLVVVVEDPWGRPVEGVQVRSAPRPSAAGQGPAAADPNAPPWRTDANGVLEVDDQPPGRLDLYLHREGYTDEVVRGVEAGEATWYATLVPN